MEQNTNRMWWTIGLIVLGGLLISGLVMIANTSVMPKISEKANALLTSGPDVTHTTYAWSADGKDRFTTNPNLNLLGGTNQNLTIQGRNHENQRGVETNQLYYFANGKNLFQQNIGTNNNVTVSFDWKATNPTSGSFFLQYNETPWNNADMGSKTHIDVTPTNSSGHVEFTFQSPDYENMGSAVATGIEPRLDWMPENTTITISNLKYEISQPKYIGTNTDKSKVMHR